MYFCSKLITKQKIQRLWKKNLAIYNEMRAAAVLIVLLSIKY